MTSRHDRELALRRDLVEAGHMVELPLRGLSAFTGTFEDAESEGVGSTG